MNLMRATFARAACGMSSRFASPRLIFRSKDFRAESWPGLNELWCSGFLATSSRAPQPQQQTGCASHSAPVAALARRLAQAARIASERGVAGRFSFSGFSVVVEVIPPLKNAKVFRHKITWGTCVTVGETASQMGNLGKDPEVFSFDGRNGKSEGVKFSLAVNRGKEDNRVTDWYECLCFGQTAKTAKEWLQKGKTVIVFGKLSFRDWERKDGKKGHSTEVITDDIQFVPRH